MFLPTYKPQWIYPQLLFKDVSSFSCHIRQCSGTHLDFHSLFAILYSVPLAKYFSSSLQLRWCLPWYVHIKHFLERINARVTWLAIYIVQKQSQELWIHKGKDFPSRSWIKWTHWVKTTLQPIKVTWQFYSKTKQSEAIFSILVRNNSSTEEHPRKALAPLAAGRAHSCDNLSVLWLQVCGKPDLPVLRSPAGAVTRGTHCWMLPAHWHLSNRHKPSIRRFQLLISQSLCVNIYRSVYCCSMKGLQLITRSSRVSSQPFREAFEHYFLTLLMMAFSASTKSVHLVPADSCTTAREAHFAFPLSATQNNWTQHSSLPYLTWNFHQFCW